MRLTREQLEEIKKENNVTELWSWSKLNLWHTSKYEWFLNYIQQEPTDRNDCIYGQEGTYSHDIIEQFYNKEIEYDNMISLFEDSYDMSRNILGLKFDRNNTDKDKTISTNYYNNLHNFFQSHQPLKYEIHTEEFALIKFGENLLQGYIDAWYKDEDDNYHIIDWKSSTIYTGDKLKKNSGQLICYAISFMQKGIPLEKIHAHFNFLKYCTIQYEQSNGKIKEMNVERRLLGEKLQSPCKMWLKKFGYNPDDYLKNILDTCSIDCLPQEIKDKINITDCYVEVEINNEIIQYWTDFVNNTIEEIESAILNYELFDDEEMFYDSIEDIQKESFYYATLSGYSPNKNICYKKYLESLENEFDIFK